MVIKGVRNVPFRVRVRLARKRNEDEEADEKVSQRGSSGEYNEDYARFCGLFHYFIDRNLRNLRK